MTLDSLVGLACAAVIVVYLFYTLLRPERF